MSQDALHWQKRVDEIKGLIPELWSAARCAAAETYLLPNSHMKPMDWSNEFKCLGLYGGYAVNVADEQQYKEYMRANEIEKAYEKLLEIFAKAQKVRYCYTLKAVNFVLFSCRLVDLIVRVVTSFSQ